MRPGFRHLKLSDRFEIQKRFPEQNMAEIARSLAVHRSTIAREIKAHVIDGKYDALVAQKLSLAKASLRFHKSTRYDLELIRFIEEKFTEDWSPDQISGFLQNRQSKIRRVSHETIYQMVYSGVARREPRYLIKKLRKYRKRRIPRQFSEISRRSIHERPKIIEKRSRIGDWEGDLIMGSKNRGAIVTMVDRKSGYLLTTHIERKTSDLFQENLRDMFSEIDNDKLHSITYDNGSEASDHKSIEEFLQCKLYFSDPGSPWQRGSNENTNGLLRRYFPKKSNLRDIDLELLDKITHSLNQRPRKRLGYRHPANSSVALET